MENKKILTLLLLVFTNFKVNSGICECQLPQRRWAPAKSYLYYGVDNQGTCQNICQAKGGRLVGFYSDTAQTQQETEKQEVKPEPVLDTTEFDTLLRNSKIAYPINSAKAEDFIKKLVQQIDLISPAGLKQAGALYKYLLYALALIKTESPIDWTKGSETYGERKVNPVLEKDIENSLNKLTEFILKNKPMPAMTPQELEDSNAIKQLKTMQGKVTDKQVQDLYLKLLPQIESILKQEPNPDVIEHAKRALSYLDNLRDIGTLKFASQTRDSHTKLVDFIIQGQGLVDPKMSTKTIHLAYIYSLINKELYQ